MNKGDIISGFRITEVTDIQEIAAVMYTMEHEKSGAQLAFLDREDQNKTFAISFSTLPQDDTGVFHILEHSVLCGSEKYPVKEPFVELLKGSLNTFLNAMTYEDRTVYPVASRNDKDFLNLVSVYTDAVFHPMAVKDPRIFRQEGWHYEAEGDVLSYNGVVYNEMKGAYSSPDELADAALSRALFPDTPFAFDYGGDPKHIPDLTFEDFVAAHEKYYHPSNARIFLDGSVKLSEVLSLLDSYLREYDKADVSQTVPTQKAVDGGTVTVRYESADGEEDKARLIIGQVVSDYSETVKNAAISLLISVLAGTNDSPLKRVMLASGKCEDFSLMAHTSRQITVAAEIKNAREEELPELEALFCDTVRQIAREGIDRELLLAGLNSAEFKLRERDYGTFPKGVAFALSAFGSWNYGGRPEAGIPSVETVAELRRLTDGDYYERLLLECTVDCPHRARVVMLPDGDAGRADERAERERLDREREAMSDSELRRVIEEYAALTEWQSTPDTEEALALLPSLSLTDITSEPRGSLPTVTEQSGVRVLHCEKDTGGITYATLYFDTSDLSEEELFFLSLLADTVVNVRTETHSALEIQSAISRDLGSMHHAVHVKDGVATPVFSMVSSALDTRKSRIAELAEETLLHSVYDDSAVIKNIISQIRSSLEEAITSGGITSSRAMAAVSEEWAIKEYFGGLEAYRLYKKYQRSFDECWEKVKETLCSLSRRIFTKERLTVTYTGERDDAFVSQLISAFPSDGIAPKKRSISTLGELRQGIAIPTKVGYAAVGSVLEGIDAATFGKLKVARYVIGYEYLWQEIRVKGGAYGTGFMTRKSGSSSFYSYRDPSPATSLEKYRESAEFLRGIAASGADMTKFIIGAIGDYDILTTPRLEGEQAVWDYLNGWSPEKDRVMREAMLNFSVAELLEAAELIERICDTGASCVVGGREVLEAFAEPLEKIHEI